MRYADMDARQIDGHILVKRVREAAHAHGKTWEMLVPSHIEINFDAEEAEEAAYAEMAKAKRRLREHICESYGITLRELYSLAQA